MAKTDNGTAQNRADIFNASGEVLIGGKKYIIERYFTGKRDMRQAVFTAVENEAKREATIRKTA